LAAGPGAASAAGACARSSAPPQPARSTSPFPSRATEWSFTVRIFSGIQPTGDPHIGNYSGGFRQYAATQERGEAFFCIVDLHALTVQQDPVELRNGTLDIAAMLFATGLDPDRSTVFVQSHAP